MNIDSPVESSLSQNSQYSESSDSGRVHRQFGNAPFFALSYIIFFFSGAAALIYEISWSRQIGLLLGQTAQAAAVVLSAYFAGLALGYHWGGRWAPRLSPLRAYGLAELFAAAWACLIPQILSWATTSPVAGLLGQTPFHVRFAIHAIFCFLILLPTTAALGVTLPLMAKFLSPMSGLSTGRVTLAYAINTLGAVLGVGSTFVMLVVVGVRASSYVAAGLSAGCGLAALTLSAFTYDSRSTAIEMSPVETPHVPQHHSHIRWWNFVAALSGFGTLALEVLYTRMFSLVFHNSTYTFGAVVAVFLLSLAMGSFVISLIHRHFRPGTILAVSSCLVAIGIPLSVAIFWSQTQFDYFRHGDSFATYLLGSFRLVALLIFPPVTLAGMILPTVWRFAEESAEAGSRTFGRLTMINTLAAVAGAVLASFLLLPVLGLWMSFLFIAGLFGAMSVGALLRQRRVAGAIISCLSMLLVFGLVVSRFSSSQSLTVDEGSKLLQRWESAYGWIDVVRDRRGHLQIRQNVHYRMGATGLNAAREYRQGHLPLLLHDHPRDVLFLGLGTGLTAAAAIQHDEVERIQIVELIPEVVEAARLLSDDNLAVVDHSQVTMQIDDARHYLLATDQRFDVIVSDLFVPWESRTGYLYTVEHYRIAQQRLQAEGLFCQWIPLYQIGPDEFECIADSFATVFPHTTLWWGQMQSQRGMVALVGSNQPLKLDAARLNERIQKIQSLEAASDSYFNKASHFLDLFIGQWAIRTPERLNTDEHPRIEFSAPISHQNGNLLKGQALRHYFDRVLSRLPTGGVHLPFESPRQQPDEHRRAWQRFFLFGETSQD